MNKIELAKYEELLCSKRDIQKERNELYVNYEKAKDKIRDLQRTNEVLAKTCKYHNAFFDEKGLREEFQKFFDEKVKEEK